jgi:hypothetical protein
MPFCTEKIVLIWKTRYKALAINTYRTEQKTKLEGKISGLCHNLMTYPSKNGRPSKNCRLSDLFGLAQSEGVQPIFLFTLSYTTNCPRNDISVKSYISIVKQNDEDTNKGASKYGRNVSNKRKQGCIYRMSSARLKIMALDFVDFRN